MFLRNRKVSKSDAYFQHQELQGHSGAILALRATDDGKFLASAGTDGTKVWDIRTLRSVEAPQTSETRGASTVLVWIKSEDKVNEGLFSGTQNGYLVCWEASQNQGSTVFQENYAVQLVEPAEVTGLAYDAPSNRLALCHRGGIVQVYVLGVAMALTEVFSIQLANAVPTGVAFGQLHGNERDVLVFSLFGGDIYTLRGNGGAEVGNPWNVGALIGGVAVDTRKGVLCLDDPSNGSSLYRLDDRVRIKTFTVKVTKKRRIRQVAFSDECQLIISGSDHGIVYIFDRRSGQTVDELRVDAQDWVQTVTASEQEGKCTIFAAKSREVDGLNTISVWRKKTKRRCGLGKIVCGMVIAIQLGFLLLAGWLVYQTTRPQYRI